MTHRRKRALVVSCPATCTKLKADTTGKIDIVQGCTTHVLVK